MFFKKRVSTSKIRIHLKKIIHDYKCLFKKPELSLVVVNLHFPFKFLEGQVMLRKASLVFICIFILLKSSAQNFTGGGGAIPDNGPAALYPVIVSGLSSPVLDSSFGVEIVCVNITHTYDADLTIQLVSPDGTTIDLSMYNGGSGDNYTNTCFSYSNNNSIVNANSPFTGYFRPQGILGNINNGQNGNGMWFLKVQDHYPTDVGAVISWNLTFSNTPAYPFYYSSSNLPIVVINTNGQTILDNPKIAAHMGIIDNGFGNRNYMTDSFNIYNGNIGIELRGSWSQTFPQKQYGFETWDSLNIAIDTPVMSMPAESDWVLYAPYNDKTCMRNVLVYDIANKTGHYAARTRFCELVLNNEYKGIYVMMEKVKRNVNRVDISKLLPTDTAGTDVTGGYIIKIDKTTGSGGSTGWNSLFDGLPGTPIRFLYEYPSSSAIVTKQKAYIKSYVDSFEIALNATWFANPDSGYKKYIDLQSFVDYFILNEVSKNVDGYRNSTFLYKEKITKGGKLVIGPAWDYNIGFRNADYCQGMFYTGWQYQFNNICGTPGDNNVPFWWAKMLQDTAFSGLLKCRWQVLRQTTLNTTTMMNEIDSIAAVLDEAKDRHFFVWPILGMQTWANPSPIPPDYPGEISSMKTWIQQRLSWLDNFMPGNCVILNAASLNSTQGKPLVYPNPFKNKLNIKFNSDKSFIINISLEDVTGRILYNQKNEYIQSGEHDLQIGDYEFLPAGVYFLKMKNNERSYVIKVVKDGSSF